ncbi:MAG: hypothetical protein K2K83_01200 [Rikenella sp.]|nr:hypothetical protein [Rikenella sp.]
MNAGGLTLMWPNREQQLAEYLGPYEMPFEEMRPVVDYCPLCGEEVCFGQHAVEGPNGYLLHSRCYEAELHNAVEWDVDVSDPQGEWLSDAISEAITARGELYDTDKFPQLWK